MRGGKRPGAGAKPKPECDKVRRFLVALSPEAAAKWEAITPGERSAMVERMLLNPEWHLLIDAIQSNHSWADSPGGQNAETSK